MLEVSRIPSDVVGCYANPATLDRLTASASLAIRVAPDELLRIGERDRFDQLEAELATLDQAAVIVDVSSAYAIWVVRGGQHHEAFCQLSEVPLPAAPGVLQALVAEVPAKVIVRPNELIILVQSLVSHHLEKRLAICSAELGTRLSQEPNVEEGLA